MKKNYFYIIILFFTFGCFSAVAQDYKFGGRSSDDTLSFYPNPVSNGKIYITSKSMEDKEVAIFDVLGKKVLQTIVTSKELSVSNLSPGVYIIKIKEGDITATRKLIVK
jgi:hypothetical protein